jgi:hypothetical protein
MFAVTVREGTSFEGESWRQPPRASVAPSAAREIPDIYAILEGESLTEPQASHSPLTWWRHYASIISWDR